MKTIKKIMKISFFSFSIVLMLNIGLVYSQTDSYGEKLLKMNQFKTAKTYFLNKIVEKPNDLLIFYYLGETYYNLGKTDSAEFYFQKVLILNPNDIYSNIGFGKIQLDKSNIDDAKKIFERAYTLSKYKDINVIAAIADALISSKNKQYDLATEYLENAKDKDKTKAIIHIVSGDMNSMREKLGDAANDYERAFYYDKNCVEAYYKLGRIYTTARNFKESIKAFESAINIDSTYIPVWRDMAEMYYSYGRYQNASDAFLKYLELTEPDLDDHIRYATILYFNKDYSKSLIETNNALLQDPKNIVMKRLNAYNLFETKDYSKSLIAINDFFKTTPESKIISTDYEYYGKILSKNNQDSLAILIYEKTMAMDSTKSNLLENVGNSYDKLKKFDKAADSYGKLIAINANPLPTDYFYLGKSAYNAATFLTSSTDSLKRIEFLQLSDTSFSKVVELSPTSYLGYFWKARVNSLLDPATLTGLAKPWYEKVISLLESNPEKYKKELIESYQYLGVYFYKLKDNEQSKSYFNKILAIDPNDKFSLDVLKELK